MKFPLSWRPGTLSLRTVLAFYFIPLSVLPAIFISIYATRVFVESSQEGLARRARSERDAILAEWFVEEERLASQARAHAGRAALKSAAASKDKRLIRDQIIELPSSVSVRLYSPNGTPMAVREGGSKPSSPIAYISKEGLERVKIRGETVDRYFVDTSDAFVTVVRILLKDQDRLYGILEEERRFGVSDLLELGQRRQVDVILLQKDFSPVMTSFALPAAQLKPIAEVLQNKFKGLGKTMDLSIGDSRYATFLYEIPPVGKKGKAWGYLAVFLSMTTMDALVGKLKTAMVYVTGLLMLVTALLIVVFSNRLVRPIEAMVLAMKRLKAGRDEQIPALDTTYEIEYLMRSFNEMARNVSAAKRALELKLDELKNANQNIKTAQTQLVQSAKMASLGQLVAGVAHELNNPIGFISSNMHHLQGYVDKVSEIVTAYRAAASLLPAPERERLMALETQLEIDFILKDMQDLTVSCVDGANRTREIVMGLRTFSRMDESAITPVDIHEGLRSTLKLLHSEIKDRIKVHESYGELPLVECNLSQLNQVFMNLLSNAAQAIEAKGQIWIRTRLEGPNVVVEIQDDGAGMSPETVSQVFDPFFTTKKVGQGTGLGLSIAYGLIERHQGKISVTSLLRKGTTFRIVLPVKQPAIAAG